MPDEIYDVIDEQGNILSQSTWTEVHTNGLLHQTAAILIFCDSSKQEVLLQRRSMAMTQKPGLLQHSAGGHVLAGQTPDEGIRRELKEELFENRELLDIEIRFVTKFMQNDFPLNKELVHIYEAIYPGPFFPDENEVAGEPIWINWDALIDDTAQHPEKYTPSFLCILKEYLMQGQSQQI